MKSVPKLRFEGFTDDWQQRKLGEVANFSKGYGYSKSDLKSEGSPIILYGRLYTKYQTTISEVDTFVDGLENSVYSKGGEVIVPASGETAKDISRASVVESSGIILGGDLNIITLSDSINSKFLALTISNGSQQKELSRQAQGKSVVHLRNSDLKEVALSSPSFDEQEKIGQLFQTIDSRIIQQKNQIELFKRLKKGYLQKIFNQEVRFSGFTQDWGMKKLGEVILKNSEKNKEVKFNNVESISNKFGFVGQSDYFENRTIASQDTSNYYVIRKGAFAFNPSRINVGSIAVKLDENISIVSPLYISFYTEKDLKDDFLWNWFKSKHFEKQRQLLTEGGVRDTLNYEALSEMVITLPTTIEQKSIGSFFEVLDSQISQADEKLSRLIKLKKAYLQKMFV